MKNVPFASVIRNPNHRVHGLFALLLVLSACGGGATATGTVSGGVDNAAAPTPAETSAPAVGATSTQTEAAAPADETAAPAPAPAEDAEPSLLSGSFETIDGSQFDLASLEGRDAVLWFWAPW